LGSLARNRSRRRGFAPRRHGRRTRRTWLRSRHFLRGRERAAAVGR
jgi:hypothetical protein